MDGVERVMVLGIFIVIVLILGVLAWDANHEPVEASAAGNGGGPGGDASAFEDPRGALAPGADTGRDLFSSLEGEDLHAGPNGARGAQGSRPPNRKGPRSNDAPQKPTRHESELPSYKDPALRLANGGAQAPTDWAKRPNPGSKPATPQAGSYPALSSNTATLGAGPATAGRRHRVQEGETVWRIATSNYGTGDMNAILDMIQEANPGVDINAVPEGTTLILPPRAPDDAVVPSPDQRVAAGEGVEYVVRDGDTLSSISRDHFGDANRWSEIYDANRTMISSPSALRVGMRLILPRDS